MGKNLEYFLQRGNNNFNLVRILCAILIIYGHATSLIFGGGADMVYQITGFNAGEIGIKVFFFLSGVFVVNSLLSNKNNGIMYFLRRIFRIFPALIFVVLFSALIIGPICTSLPINTYFSDCGVYKYIADNISLNIWGNNNIGLPGVFTNNYYPTAVNSPLWALVPICISYLLFWAFYSIGFFRKKFAVVFFGLVILECLIQKRIFFHCLPINDANLGFIPFCFSVGALFAIFKDKIVIDFRVLVSLFIITIFFKNTVFYIPLAYLMFFVAFTYIAINKNIVKFNIKDISYGIYLWGFPIQQTIIHFMPNIHMLSYLILTYAVVLVFSIISFQFVEKPLNKLCKNIQNKLQTYEFLRNAL